MQVLKRPLADTLTFLGALPSMQLSLLLIIVAPVVHSLDPTPSITDDIMYNSRIPEGVNLKPSTTAASFAFGSSWAGCGGNLTNSTGQLTHPNYPRDMPNIGTCTWQITLAPGSRVALHFSFLNLELSDACAKDSLEVLDARSSVQTRLKEYCGSLERPESLVTSGNEVEVRMRSNSTQSGRGFLITYSEFEGCNKTLTSSSGVIESPYYPDSYPLNVNCTYRIQVTAGQLVSLAIEFLDLAYSSACSDDALEVWDGPVGNSALIGRYCGYMIGQWVQSSGNELTVQFRSDLTETRRGFKVLYRAVQSGCNKTLNAAIEGTILSPKQTGENCFWVLQAPAGHVISIVFDRFYLQQTEDCSRDHLVIKEGGSVIGRYCGYQKGELIYSKTDEVRLEYESTSGLANAGLQIHYTSLLFECGGYLNSSRGSIQSPRYPDNYPNNVYCAWQIEQRPGYAVDLLFLTLDLEFAVNCSRDYIEVFDGPDNSSQSLGRFCSDKDVKRHVVTSGNAMLVEFVTNGRVARSGFDTSYTQYRGDCPRNFTNASGIVESPNYPDFYPKGYDCSWLISYELGYQIYVTFTYFELDYSAHCSGDYLEFLDGFGVNATPRGKYCGYLVTREQVVSTGHQMAVRFHSDEAGGNSRGFVLSYTVDGTARAPPPRTPSLEDIEQAVKITLKDLTEDKWITNRDILFRKLIANATIIYCANEPSKCKAVSQHRERKSIDVEVNITFRQVHLVPDFPIPGQGRSLVVVLYVLYPVGLSLDPSRKSTAIPQRTLVKAVNASVDYISAAFGWDIISIEPYTLDTSPTPTPWAEERETGEIALLIGLSVAGGLLLAASLIAIVLYSWRKKNRGKFLVHNCVTPIEFADEKVELKATAAQRATWTLSPRRRASTLKVCDLEDNDEHAQ
ncbi:bone morphogenetic protein 1 [Nematostella vectensis]|uniref:bone morphogenetic protein 1 n=1 Tax=Nematostella vectensis TaxID=45351 RepID=UPI0020775F09|nr:bone morphogenetic protein 1 [Nematostella vectensis]